MIVFAGLNRGDLGRSEELFSRAEAGLAVVYPSTMSSPGTDSESDREPTPPPLKRARQSGSPRTTSTGTSNVKISSILPTSPTATLPIMNNPSNLPPLSVSILGVEPLDEFIREIADFVHHMVTTRPNMGPDAKVEVEAKLGVLRDRTTGKRISLPVLVETSAYLDAILRATLTLICLSPSPRWNGPAFRIKHVGRWYLYAANSDATE